MVNRTFAIMSSRPITKTQPAKIMSTNTYSQNQSFFTLPFLYPSGINNLQEIWSHPSIFVIRTLNPGHRVEVLSINSLVSLSSPLCTAGASGAGPGGAGGLMRSSYSAHISPSCQSVLWRVQKRCPESLQMKSTPSSCSCPPSQAGLGQWRKFSRLPRTARVER